MNHEPRFTVHRYREDLAHLCYKVVDSSLNEVIEGAMSESDAEELADAMNSLHDTYYA